MKSRYIKLLEVYDLLEILYLIDLEPVEVLEILDDQGYLDKLDTPEAL